MICPSDSEVPSPGLAGSGSACDAVDAAVCFGEWIQGGTTVFCDAGDTLMLWLVPRFPPPLSSSSLDASTAPALSSATNGAGVGLGGAGGTSGNEEADAAVATIANGLAADVRAFRFGPASVEGPEVDDYGCVALDPFDEAGAKLTGGDLSFADVFPMHYALSEADWV